MSWKDESEGIKGDLLVWVGLELGLSGELLGNVCRSRRMLGWGRYGSVKVF